MLLASPAVPSAGEEPCFHCSLPIPAGTDLRVQVEGSWHRVCCPGCQAIVLSITDRGLERFYRLRCDGAAGQPDAAPSEADDLAIYDDEALQAPAGFAGRLGIFRLLPSGLSEHGLAVVEITGGSSTRLLDPAPSAFTPGLAAAY